MQRKKAALNFCLAFLLLLSLKAVCFPRIEAQEGSGDITFLPNVIPFTTVYKEVNKTSNIEGSGERFRFEWNNPLEEDDPNRFDVELFFNATIYKKYEGVLQNITKMWSLHDFEGDFNCSTIFMKNQNESLIQWGWEIDNPDITNEWLHQGWMRIEDTYPFDVDDIQLETIEPMPPELNFTIKRFHLPDNLVLSFEDLFFKGFMVDVLNVTDVVIMGFEGKTHLNLDPITFSAPTITVIGETGKGDTEANGYSFNDLYNASVVNSWDVVDCFEPENTTYEFGATIKLGDDSTTTWFVDENVQVTFNSSCIASNWQTALIKLERQSHLRLGNLINSDNKRTKYGVSILDLEDHSHLLIQTDSNSEVNIYGCLIVGKSIVDPLFHIDCDDTFKSEIYETTFDNCYLYSTSYAVDVTLYRINQKDTLYGIRYMGGTMEDVSIHTDTNALYWHGAYVTTGYSITDLKVRNSTILVLTSSLAAADDSYLINADVDSWTFTWGGTNAAEIYRQYTFDSTFTFDDGSYAEGTNVTISNEYLGTSDSWILASNGSIPQQTYSYGHYNQTGGNTIYNYNPYNITATLDGYDTYTQLINITKTEALTIALIEETESADDLGAVYYMLGGVSLLPVSLLFAFLGRKKNAD